MSVPALLVTLAFLSAGATSQEVVGACGPFVLTTTSGTLYSAPNGTQLPGSTETELEEGRYIISENGTLTDINGSLCEFRPFLTCLPNITNSEGDGAFVIGEYGRLSYSNNDTFNSCPGMPDVQLYEDGRIYPGSLHASDEAAAASCSLLAMQASRCHPGEDEDDANSVNGTTSPGNSSDTGSNATGEDGGANSTEEVAGTSGAGESMRGLSASLYGLLLFIGFVAL